MNSCTDTSSDFTCFGENDTLTLKGMRIDTITDQSDLLPTTPGNDDLSNISSWLKQCDTLAESCGGNERVHLVEDTLWRTLIIDTADRCRPAPHEFKAHYDELWHFVNNYPTTTDEEMYAWFGTHARKFFREMASKCQGRRLAISIEKRIGLVSETAQPGDSLVVFDGFAVPFVLRADRRRRFRLIGDCYVHGIMYGEAVGQAIRPLRSRRHAYKSEELTLM